MELAQLKYFQELAQMQNLTQTAKKLYISPPALSESIGKLERELGVQLFNRTNGKSLKLNESGRELLACVDRIFTDLDSTVAQLKNLSEAKKSTLFIAAVSPTIFQGLFVAFRKLHPEIRISQVYSNLHQLADHEWMNRFDFLVAPPEDVDAQELTSVPLYEDDEPMLSVYDTHPFAERSSVDVQELKGVPFIVPGKDISSRKMFDSVFAEAGIIPNVLYECDHFTRASLIRDKEGIGLTSLYTMFCDKTPDLVYVPLSGSNFHRKQHLFWNKNRRRSKAAALFQEFAVDYYQKLTAEVKEYKAQLLSE